MTNTNDVGLSAYASALEAAANDPTGTLNSLYRSLIALTDEVTLVRGALARYEDGYFDPKTADLLDHLSKMQDNIFASAKWIRELRNDLAGEEQPRDTHEHAYRLYDPKNFYESLVGTTGEMVEPDDEGDGTDPAATHADTYPDEPSPLIPPWKDGDDPGDWTLEDRFLWAWVNVPQGSDLTTYEDLAKAAGVSATTIRRMADGTTKQGRAKTLRSVAVALGYGMDLFDD
jgi:hypothetical protein